MIEKVLTRFIIPLALIIGAGVCAGLMVLLSPSAERAVPAPQVAIVEVLEAAPTDQIAQVRATGTVQPARQVTLTPEVAGRIVEVHPDLVPGGRIPEGEVAVRIDPRDFVLTVRQEEARVRQAEVEYQLELGRKAIAEREWELLGDGRPSEDAPLALREPQLLAAERNLEGARSGLARAELALSRTAIRVPFDAIVLSEGAEIGQVVAGTSQVATLVGTETLWVKVSIPFEQLDALVIPNGEGTPTSRATIRHTLPDGSGIVRHGEILRLLGELDPQTRTASLLVEADAPFEGNGLPLLPGAFVDVAFEGRELPGTFRIPRVAVSEGDRVWVVTDHKLTRRTLEIGWRTDDTLVITDGLEPGEYVVTSPLALAIEGMPVQIQGTEPAEAAR